MTVIVGLEGIMLVCVLLMHAAKQNTSVVLLYAFQSVAITSLLVALGVTGPEGDGLLVSAVLTGIVKVMIAPVLFFRLIRRHQLKRSGSTYLNLPLTLFVLLVLIATIQSDRFAPLTTLSDLPAHVLLLPVSSLVASFFLLVNRKGALSQMIGILSIENSIVAFAAQLGTEQTISLELGIAFDILVWIIIATTFIGLIQRHFGSLDSTVMKQLTD